MENILNANILYHIYYTQGKSKSLLYNPTFECNILSISTAIEKTFSASFSFSLNPNTA